MSSTNLAPVTSRSVTFRKDIQGLRAIAIILVIALHMNLTGFSAGYIGVDIFFVVSGYVITLSILKKTDASLFSNLKEFWKSRFIRIFPAAALVISITVLAAFLFSGKAFNSDLLADARWATFYATNFRLISTGANYFIAGLDQSLLTHYWALAVEQQFYLIYPVLIFLLMRFRSNKLLIRIALILLILTSSYWSISQTLIDPVASYYSPFTRIWELAFGGLLATFANRQNPWLSILGLAILASSLFCLSPTSAYPGVLAWLPVLGTGLLLLFPLEMLGVRPLRYLGDISYSLYLWHFIWLVLPMQIENPITGFSWLFLLGAIVCAVLTYHFFERPIHRSVALRSDGFSSVMVALICLLSAWLTFEFVENLYLQSIL